MATTNDYKIELEMTYTDYTTRKYKIPIDLEREGADTLPKTAIQAFNAAASDSSSSVAQTFLSNNGAAVANISAATIIMRTEEVIYGE